MGAINQLASLGHHLAEIAARAKGKLQALLPGSFRE